jgi:hypothetical protein
MQGQQGSRSGSGKRRPWTAPAMTKLPIGTETKSNPKAPGADSDQARPAHPPVPAVPAMKLGFSFEMAFPMSARTDL